MRERACNKSKGCKQELGPLVALIFLSWLACEAAKVHRIVLWYYRPFLAYNNCMNGKQKEIVQYRSACVLVQWQCIVRIKSSSARRQSAPVWPAAQKITYFSFFKFSIPHIQSSLQNHQLFHNIIFLFLKWILPELKRCILLANNKCLMQHFGTYLSEIILEA